jgi:hypothetical protein
MLRSAASVAFACVCQAAVAHAAITSRETIFTAQCTDQAATAFQWKGGQWVLVPYFPNIYRVDKRAASSPGCAEILAAKSALSATFDDVSYGCYRITPFAQDTTPPIVCVEHWTGPERDAALQNVTCAGEAPYHWIVFDPGGIFQFAQLEADSSIAPADGMKDPLILSVGRCTVVRQQ